MVQNPAKPRALLEALRGHVCHCCEVRARAVRADGVSSRWSQSIALLTELLPGSRQVDANQGIHAQNLLARRDVKGTTKHAGVPAHRMLHLFHTGVRIVHRHQVVHGSAEL
eukprot:CAMPEP_0115190468 /NCGR_PEP_ID=MMETSP0270-20121206/12040_1 /TAXON_ID=71861 /ORGANISM="Scrippsiella trochoidea, Strain CCMP3099" /LENGTH=110 /DNA_ID=CAMNT_0002603679 /DNA_START=313 /DNA_END=642 /DNA_ORIENTATION=-